MTILLSAAGFLLLGLAAAHALFPRYFGWREELSHLSLLTRQIFYVHHFFIALTVGLMGLLTVLRSEQLLTTSLGRELCLGFGLFWFLRLYCQLFKYHPSLWRGKRLETVAHILFSLLWVYLTAVYLVAGLKRFSP